MSLQSWGMFLRLVGSVRVNMIGLDYGAFVTYGTAEDGKEVTTAVCYGGYMYGYGEVSCILSKQCSGWAGSFGSSVCNT
jgi:hypothetical protein